MRDEERYGTFQDIAITTNEFLENINMKDRQIAELQQKCERLDKERYEESLNLQQFYSRLGVDAYCEDIQEQAIKELEKLQLELADKDNKIQELLDYTIMLENGWNYQEYLKLQAKLHTQPREIIEKIRENLANNNLEIISTIDNYSYTENFLEQILKEYEEETK